MQYSNTLLFDRLNWKGSKRCADFHEKLMIFNQLRLLSDLGNGFWRFSFALLIPTYIFVNLTTSLAGAATGASSLPAYVYAFLPANTVSSVVYLMYFVPVLASVHSNSKTSIANTNRALAKLEDLDRRSLNYFKRVIRAQRPFGFQMRWFSFISLNTAQDVITNSVSYSLVIISLTK